jgi:hypothetical protein
MGQLASFGRTSHPSRSRPLRARARPGSQPPEWASWGLRRGGRAARARVPAVPPAEPESGREQPPSRFRPPGAVLGAQEIFISVNPDGNIFWAQIIFLGVGIARVGEQPHHVLELHERFLLPVRKGCGPKEGCAAFRTTRWLQTTFCLRPVDDAIMASEHLGGFQIKQRGSLARVHVSCAYTILNHFTLFKNIHLNGPTVGFDSGSGLGSSSSGSHSCPSSPRRTPPPRSHRHHRHHHHDRHHNSARRSQPAGLAPTPCESCSSARPCSSKLPTTSATSPARQLESGLLTSHKVSLAISLAQRQGK